jgi:endonuclease/exonuclease/phosphatase family metal-dependent hydrolase
MWAIRWTCLLAVAQCAGPVAHAANIELTALRIMSLNIRYGTADDGENSWVYRREAVAERIAAAAPDVLGLQECLWFQAEYLDEQLPDYQWFAVGREADGSGETMAVFYRHEVVAPVRTRHFWLSATPEVAGSSSWDSACPRMVTAGVFHHYPTGRRFHVYNTHFDHRSAEARFESARLVAKEMEQLPKGEAAILMGDFNARAETSEPWKVLAENHLRDARLAAAEVSGPEGTYNGFGIVPEGLRPRIDWIMVRGAIETERFVTIDSGGQSPYTSDHHAVVATFRFRAHPDETPETQAPSPDAD